MLGLQVLWTFWKIKACDENYLNYECLEEMLCLSLCLCFNTHTFMFVCFVCQDPGASRCLQKRTAPGHNDPAGRVKGHCQWQCCLPDDWAAAPGGSQHTDVMTVRHCPHTNTKHFSRSVLSPCRTVSFSVQTVPTCLLVIPLRGAGTTGAATTTTTSSLSWPQLKASTWVSRRGLIK